MNHILCASASLRENSFAQCSSPVLSVFTTLVLAFLFIAPQSASGDETGRLPSGEIADGWIKLFDGETLFGWQPTGEAKWRVEAGAIRTDGKQPGFLMTTTQFADFELVVEYRTTPATNSGIFLRTPLEPTDPATECYELNIAPPENPFPTGSFVGRQRIDAAAILAEAAAGDWHLYVVRAEGGQISVMLDGKPILDYKDSSPVRRGQIGLQSNTGEIEFRKVWLRPLGLKPMLNGRDLAGWNTDQAGDSTFAISDAGELHMLGGRGQIESTDRYADFIMQLECKVNGDGLNSGVFFRSIPGDFQMGYESQISNTTIDGDRTRPADHGTGGIFRRQPARRVVANDHVWFTKTIIADGPHMACWVDGYQVSDWTDDRPANPNPRRGLRLEAGTIILQGHDPTTDLLFRQLRIGELPK